MKKQHRRWLAAGGGLVFIVGAGTLSFSNLARHVAGVGVMSILPALPTQARLATLRILGRNDCSWVDALKAVEDTATEKRIIQRLFRTSRMIQKDRTGLELWNTEHGPFWIIAGSDMERFFHTLAEQEIGVYQAPGVEVRRGDIVLDCGANYGVFARNALNRGASLVVAIEPVPQNVACLQRTFADEIRGGSLIVVPKGVWDTQATLPLDLDPSNSWGAEVTTARPDVPVGMPGFIKIAVPLTRIDELVRDLRLPRVDFIKMDIEGAEQRALDGARETIGRYTPRMAICVYHRPDDLQEVPKRVPWFYGRLPGHCEDHRTSIKREVFLFW